MNQKKCFSLILLFFSLEFFFLASSFNLIFKLSNTIVMFSEGSRRKGEYNVNLWMYL